MCRVQALPAKEGQFNNRVSLSKKFCGLRGEDLNKIIGSTDAEFVHAAGFIGGAWSSNTCLKMAEMSLSEHNELVLGKDLEKKQKIE